MGDRKLRRRLTVWYIYIIISPGCGHSSHAVREAAGRVHNAGQVQAGTNQVLDTKIFFRVTQYIFRSQLEYETFLKNYELNQYVYLNMVGISAFQKSSEYFLPFCHHSLFQRAMRHADNMVWVKKYMNGRYVKNKFEYERISVYYSGALVGGRGVNVFLCTFVASKSINMCQLRSAKWLYFFCTQLRCIFANFIGSNRLILK